MPISEKTKNRLLIPFAISPIMRFGALPGLVGLVMMGIGIYQQIDALKIIGFVLTIPILWVYIVIIFVYIPFAIVDKLWNR